MTASEKRLDRAFEQAQKLTISNFSKVVLMSDIHRGDASFADEFARNRNIFAHALGHYYEHDYQYIELGDGNELWENRNFNALYSAHKNIYKLLKKFHLEKRLHLIWGNHDMVYKNPKYVQADYSQVMDDKTRENVKFLPDLEYHEAVKLEHAETGKSILCLHGHQADYKNYVFWRFNRFFVYYFWKPLQILGFYDPTSPAKNHNTLQKVEQKLKDWVKSRSNQMLIAGHTHRPRFPKTNEAPFFNDGSAVHPRSITAIEINTGEIQLVKWLISTSKDGTLKVVKELLEGPERLEDYLC